MRVDDIGVDLKTVGMSYYCWFFIHNVFNNGNIVSFILLGPQYYHEAHCLLIQHGRGCTYSKIYPENLLVYHFFLFHLHSAMTHDP